MIGCPGCGLFLDHVPGCRGVIAVYWRYHSRYKEDGFQTVEAAREFLDAGEDQGAMSAGAVLLPDGTVALDADALHPWRTRDTSVRRYPA
jgi:hypothetical protein